MKYKDEYNIAKKAYTISIIIYRSVSESSNSILINLFKLKINIYRDNMMYTIEIIFKTIIIHLITQKGMSK